LTGVTLVDQYDTSVLAFSRAVLPEDAYDPTLGLITWTNVATLPFAPSIPPGQVVSVTVVFTAEHPKPAVVNYARAQDLIHEAGLLSYTAETSETQESQGGAAPVFKALWPTTSTVVAGLPVTFSQVITNDGAAFLTYLPLTDTYDPQVLQFFSAVPTPTVVTPPGLLVWDNLADPAYFGPITPFQTIVVTTVFTALTDILTTVNEASTEGAQDQYNNDVAGGAAQVPIIILPAPTDTPTTEPTPLPTDTPAATSTSVPTTTPNRDDDDDDDDNDQPTPIPAATWTPAAVVFSSPLSAPMGTPVPFPSVLPETGQPVENPTWWLVGGSFMMVLIWWLKSRR
jgi:hypothetical protein